MRNRRFIRGLRGPRVLTRLRLCTRKVMGGRVRLRLTFCLTRVVSSLVLRFDVIVLLMVRVPLYG